MTSKGVVLVTGGTSGIGFAISGELLAHGWRVAAVDIQEKTVEAARAAYQSHGASFTAAVMDVTDEAAVIAGVAEIEAGFGSLTGLVNCAGIAQDVPFLDTTVAQFRKILDINLVGSFVVAREVVKYMLPRKSGAVVNIASVSGIRGNLGRTAYGASKGGVITMTKVMAVELAPLGIRVNAIAPGPVETPLVKAVHTAEARAGWLKTVPQRRYSDPKEIAGTARFLLDDAMAGFITGQTIAVDAASRRAG